MLHIGIQASESLKFVRFAGALYTFGQPAVDMFGVFRCTEHFYARIIAQDPIPDSHKNGFSAAPVSNRKTVQCGKRP